MRAKGVDGRFQRAGRHQLWVVGVAAKVQDLHGDFAASGVHRFGHDLVFVRFLLRGHTRAARQGAAPVVGRYAAGHDQAYTATRPLGIKSGHARKAVFGFLQTHMHGAHDDAVFKFSKTQVQGFEQMGVGVHAGVLGRWLLNQAALHRRCANRPIRAVFSTICPKAPARAYRC